MTFGHFIVRVVSDWTCALQTGLELELEEGSPLVTAQADFLLHPVTVTTIPSPNPLSFSAPVFSGLAIHTPVAVQIPDN